MAVLFFAVTLWSPPDETLHPLRQAFRLPPCLTPLPHEVSTSHTHLGPPGAIGEEFTVSQHGHEDVSHEQSLLYMEKQWVVHYGISSIYGRTALLRLTVGTRDCAPWPS
jgi:hypothetical protein